MDLEKRLAAHLVLFQWPNRVVAVQTWDRKTRLKTCWKNEIKNVLGINPKIFESHTTLSYLDPPYFIMFISSLTNFTDLVKTGQFL